jgi:hypothetical protein
MCSIDLLIIHNCGYTVAHSQYNCQDADNMLSLQIVCTVSKNQGELRTALDCAEASSALPEVKIQLDQICVGTFRVV